MKEMLTKEQMKKISGGYNFTYTCINEAGNCGVGQWVYPCLGPLDYCNEVCFSFCQGDVCCSGWYVY